jgi:SAM-dependent methyltransferase
LAQSWFGKVEGKSGRDPYVLSASSNAGSLLALAAFPLWIERAFSTGQQLALWRSGLFAMAALVAVCAAVRPRRGVEPPATIAATLRRRLRDAWLWGVLAFVPSVLMLGVTAHLTTDLAAVPLLWVIPLGLYLLSMILAFAGFGGSEGGRAEAILPALLIPTALVLAIGLVQLVWLPLHLLCFFVAALVIHRALASRRPEPARLTEYYLAIAVGGAVGGAFCALVAPSRFDRLVEYPMALVGVGFILAWRSGRLSSQGIVRRSLVAPLVVGLSAAALVSDRWSVSQGWLGPPLTMLAAGLALLAFLTPRKAPLRFAMTLGAILVASGFATGINGRVLLRERNAFGVLTVTAAPEGDAHRLFHGSTLHGQQDLDPSRRREPLTYFTKSGPVGQIFEAFRESRPLRVGVTGVGAGTLASYARSGDNWCFYEIDPAVIDIARDNALFTYLGDCKAGPPRIVQGDARLSIAREPDARFDLLILDAFSSDAVPVHLLTREAIALYRRKLKPGGRLVFNLSNRYLDLSRAVASLAADAGWVCRARVDAEVSLVDEARGKRGSIWAVVAADAQALGALGTHPDWRSPAVRPRDRVWSDESSSLLDYLRLPGRTRHSAPPPSALP